MFNLWNLLNERCSTSDSLSPAERNVTDPAHKNAQPMLCLGGKPGILWQHPGSGSRSRVAQCLWDSVKTQCFFFFYYFIFRASTPDSCGRNVSLFCANKSGGQHRGGRAPCCSDRGQTNTLLRLGQLDGPGGGAVV